MRSSRVVVDSRSPFPKVVIVQDTFIFTVAKLLFVALKPDCFDTPSSVIHASYLLLPTHCCSTHFLAEHSILPDIYPQALVSYNESTRWCEVATEPLISFYNEPLQSKESLRPLVSTGYLRQFHAYADLTRTWWTSTRIFLLLVSATSVLLLDLMLHVLLARFGIQAAMAKVRLRVGVHFIIGALCRS